MGLRRDFSIYINKDETSGNDNMISSLVDYVKKDETSGKDLILSSIVDRRQNKTSSSDEPDLIRSGSNESGFSKLVDYTQHRKNTLELSERANQCWGDASKYQISPEIISKSASKFTRSILTMQAAVPATIHFKDTTFEISGLTESFTDLAEKSKGVNSLFHDEENVKEESLVDFCLKIPSRKDRKESFVSEVSEELRRADKRLRRRSSIESIIDRMIEDDHANRNQ